MAALRDYFALVPVRDDDNKSIPDDISVDDPDEEVLCSQCKSMMRRRVIYEHECIDIAAFMVEDGHDSDIIEPGGRRYKELVELLRTRPGDYQKANKYGFHMTHIVAAVGTPDAMDVLLAAGHDTLRPDTAASFLHDPRGGSSPSLPGGLLPIHYAARCGNVAMVDRLAEAGSVDVVDPLPLYLAASHGHCEVIAALIALGADASRPISSGVTPLVAAAIGGHTTSCVTLLADGAEMAPAVGRDPEQWAALAGYADTADVLHAVAHGAQPRSGVDTPYSPYSDYGSPRHQMARLVDDDDVAPHSRTAAAQRRDQPGYDTAADMDPGHYEIGDSDDADEALTVDTTRRMWADAEAKRNAKLLEWAHRVGIEDEWAVAAAEADAADTTGPAAEGLNSLPLTAPAGRPLPYEEVAAALRAELGDVRPSQVHRTSDLVAALRCRIPEAERSEYTPWKIAPAWADGSPRSQAAAAAAGPGDAAAAAAPAAPLAAAAAAPPTDAAVSEPAEVAALEDASAAAPPASEAETADDTASAVAPSDAPAAAADVDGESAAAAAAAADAPPPAAEAEPAPAADAPPPPPSLTRDEQIIVAVHKYMASLPEGEGASMKNARLAAEDAIKEKLADDDGKAKVKAAVASYVEAVKAGKPPPTPVASSAAPPASGGAAASDAPAAPAAKPLTKDEQIIVAVHKYMASLPEGEGASMKNARLAAEAAIGDKLADDDGKAKIKAAVASYVDAVKAGKAPPTPVSSVAGSDAGGAKKKTAPSEAASTAASDAPAPKPLTKDEQIIVAVHKYMASLPPGEGASMKNARLAAEEAIKDKLTDEDGKAKVKAAVGSYMEAVKAGKAPPTPTPASSVAGSEAGDTKKKGGDAKEVPKAAPSAAAPAAAKPLTKDEQIIVAVHKYMASLPEGEGASMKNARLAAEAAIGDKLADDDGKAKIKAAVASYVDAVKAGKAPPTPTPSEAPSASSSAAPEKKKSAPKAEPAAAAAKEKPKAASKDERIVAAVHKYMASLAAGEGASMKNARLAAEEAIGEKLSDEAGKAKIKEAVASYAGGKATPASSDAASTVASKKGGAAKSKDEQIVDAVHKYMASLPEGEGASLKNARLAAEQAIGEKLADEAGKAKIKEAVNSYVAKAKK